jgi:hypothetical protein
MTLLKSSLKALRVEVKTDGTRTVLYLFAGDSKLFKSSDCLAGILLLLLRFIFISITQYPFGYLLVPH